MLTKKLLVAVSGMALVSAQVPPPTGILSTVLSGVLPVLPTETPFTGLETIEGAIVNDGPVEVGFTGEFPFFLDVLGAMQSFTLVTTLFSLKTITIYDSYGSPLTLPGPGGNATIQTSNPAATYIAVLPPTNFDPATGSIITGSITGTATANGTGILLTVNLTGFPSPSLYGPFVYHIHTLPVPADGNCSATLGHLDPTDRGEYHPCEMLAPETCQAGDLAGKHGNITGTELMTSYQELYLSTTPGSPYFFGDKSLVVHTSNTTRLTCANFVLVEGGGNGTATGTATGATPTPSAFMGAAGKKVGVQGLLAGMVAVAWAMLL
jgi:hypothetical protein